MKIKILPEVKVTENFNTKSYNQPISGKLLFRAKL